METLSKSCAACGITYTKKSWMNKSKWEQSQYCSLLCFNKHKERPHLKQYQVKKGEHLGAATQFKKGQNKGASNVLWKGDAASYAAKHIWARNNFGQPKECEHCGVTDRKMYHWANISGQYKRERSDWLRLCVPCHKRMDLSTLRANVV